MVGFASRLTVAQRCVTKRFVDKRPKTHQNYGLLVLKTRRGSAHGLLLEIGKYGPKRIVNIRSGITVSTSVIACFAADFPVTLVSVNTREENPVISADTRSLR